MPTIKIQPIPYQGSKRNIAEKIMQHAPKHFKRLIEPFAGSAAVSLYAASHKMANKFVINDSYKPLINLWEEIIERPEVCAKKYEEMWNEQLNNSSEYYLKIREKFNNDGDPIKFLYLMMRCVKNAIRFNSSGKFNQSPDNRRLGRHPHDMRKQLLLTSLLLKGKTTLMNADYEQVLESAMPEDLIYMDPPYQGTSNGRNPRYHQGIDLERFISNVQKLNKRKIPFILSFDGQLGERKYGELLPQHLNLEHMSLCTGRSAQATLNGKADLTIESLYLSSSMSSFAQFSLAVAA